MFKKIITFHHEDYLVGEFLSEIIFFSWKKKKSWKNNQYLIQIKSSQTLLVCMFAFAIISALQVDESVVGELADVDTFNPEAPQEILKLKKLKKLLLGWKDY